MKFHCATLTSLFWVSFCLSSAAVASRISIASRITIAALRGGDDDDNDDANLATNASPIILRIRLPDGSIQKIQVPSNDISLKEVLRQSYYDDMDDNDNNNDDDDDDNQNTIILGTNNKPIDDESLSLSALGLQHGSLITIRNKSGLLDHQKNKNTKPSFAQDYTDASTATATFHPFPDLHKNHDAVVRASRARTKGRGSSSFGDLSNLHASLHVVEHQPEGPLQRVYMCHKSATRFQASCSSTTTSSTSNTASKLQNRVGLLLGTIQRERVDTKPKKVRTSLSTIPSEQDYCQVAKVHAIWEPQQQTTTTSNNGDDDDDDEVCYDASTLLDRNGTDMQRILTVANHLGLQPVGWIFTYSDNRHENNNNNYNNDKDDTVRTSATTDAEDGVLSVWALDIVTGARLQISEMKARDRIEGAKFVTLAMNAPTGTTEAFQLSNVAVQMVAENMFMMEQQQSSSLSSSDSKNSILTEPKLKITNINNNKKKKKKKKKAQRRKKNGRYVKTRHAIVVDGREVSTLDTVLCLVNTALLSHLGLYAGNTKKKPIKKNGSLTLNTKKNILASIATTTTSATNNNQKTQKNNNTKDSELLNLLSDFSILLALDTLLGNDTDTQELCRVVQKWVRGQKQGTQVSDTLKRKLQTVLSH